jgi:biopolymer transport protein ExbB
MVGAGAEWVLWLMLALSVISLAIMLERAWLFYTLRDDVEAIMRDLAKLLRAGDLKGAKARLEQSPSSEAAVVVAGLAEVDLGHASAEEAMAGAQALQKLKLERRLAFLGTLGNNAPFIGLLGTVIGILGTFQLLKGSVSIDVIGPKISEALISTALGLGVAIIAAMSFNFFTSRVELYVVDMNDVSSEFIDYVLREGRA